MIKSMSRLLLYAVCAMVCHTAAHGQTDEQYYAALGSIQSNTAYHILTTQNGTSYYLTTSGTLTADKTLAGRFVFRQTQGSQLFRSPGWATDNNFTNPQLSGGQQGSIVQQGHLLTNGAGRDDWEGQVWYKQGDSYAVRATNARSQNWGAATYWVTTDNNLDLLPEADYDWQPQYVWQIEQTQMPNDEDTYQRLTNLPHIYINTFTGGNITSKTSYVYAKMRYVDERDSITTYDSIEIRGRGNSTWNMEKKPYKLKFHQKEKLLGQGYAKARKWTLLANHGDKTMLRNALTSFMGQQAGLKFNPAARFVDLTLNGQYQGTYQLSDQVDVRPHRVNITEQDYPLNAGSDISGGYLAEVDGFQDFHTGPYQENGLGPWLAPDGFYTAAQRVPIRIHYPDADELDQRQTQYIRDYVNTFEQALMADDFTLPTGWRSMVDTTSLANWYICTELSGNIDGFFSTYIYKEQADDRLYWGPLWDYDIAYGNDNRLGDTTEQLMKDIGYGVDNGCAAWVRRFWQDPSFAAMIDRRYGELLSAGMEPQLLAAIDSLATLIDQSQQLNYQRWGISTRTLRERVLYSTYEQYLADLRQYVKAHTAYLKTAFALLAGQEPGPEPQPVEQGFTPEQGVCYAIDNAGSGTRMDINTESMDICCRAATTDSHSQQWLIRRLANGYLHLTHRATGMALNDPTRGLPTATTLLGDTLNVAAADTTDTRQQWLTVAQAAGRFNLVNRYSQHAANLMGGNSANGTPVLSYTNNAANATSNNRQWVITAVDHTDTGIEHATTPTDYALAYDHTGHRLHFGAERPELLRFTARVYDQAGRLVTQFAATDEQSTAAWPAGIYIISWNYQGHTRHTKLMIK